MMTPRDFCYWLNGFIEVSKCKEMTEEQVEEVRKHLKLVFENKEPNYDIVKLSESHTFPATSFITGEITGAHIDSPSPFYRIYNEFTNDVPASC